MTSLQRLEDQPLSWSGTSIVFLNQPEPPGRTTRWKVQTKSNDAFGWIKWHGPSRCYAFLPVCGCILEEVSMRELAQFVVDRTAEHKEGTWAK